MQSTSIPDKPLLRPDEVARLFQVTKKTVYQWHSLGKLPGGLKFGDKCLRFDRESVVLFMSQGTSS